MWRRHAPAGGTAPPTSCCAFHAATFGLAWPLIDWQSLSFQAGGAKPTTHSHAKAAIVAADRPVTLRFQRDVSRCCIASAPLPVGTTAAQAQRRRTQARRRRPQRRVPRHARGAHASDVARRRRRRLSHCRRESRGRKLCRRRSGGRRADARGAPTYPLPIVSDGVPFPIGTAEQSHRPAPRRNASGVWHGIGRAPQRSAQLARRAASNIACACTALTGTGRHCGRR